MDKCVHSLWIVTDADGNVERAEHLGEGGRGDVMERGQGSGGACEEISVRGVRRGQERRNVRSGASRSRSCASTKTVSSVIRVVSACMSEREKNSSW